MGSPLVRCSACERTWHSATMAEGLRELGACPRCGGELLFSVDAPASPAQSARVGVMSAATAPHLVLGVPRR